MEVSAAKHKFKSYLTPAKDNEWSLTLFSFCPFNQALIVIGARQMSGLGCAIPFKLLFHDCRERRVLGRQSVLMRRGCIRGAGVESLERRLEQDFLINCESGLDSASIFPPERRK